MESLLKSSTRLECFVKKAQTYLRLNGTAEQKQAAGSFLKGLANIAPAGGQQR